MKKILIWDLPTRLFHWIFAAGVITSFTLAVSASEKSVLFGLHMLFALVLVPLLLFRLFWGFVGTRHARFISFLHSPQEVADYLNGIVGGTAKRHVGHNPVASYAILEMLPLLCATIGSGVVTTGGNELLEEADGVFAYGVAALVGAHLAGILVHALAHKENLVSTMLTGKKDAPAAVGICSSCPWSAATLMVVFNVWCVLLANGYKPANPGVASPLPRQDAATGKK